MSFKLPRFFEFAGKSSADFGLYLKKRPDYPIPERNVLSYEIPGRNGAVHIDQGGYRDVEITLDCMLKGEFATASAIANWLNSGHGNPLPLRITEFPGVYFEAVPADGISIQHIVSQFHEFQLKFNARPQKFLDSGEKPIVFIVPDDFPDLEPYIGFGVFNPGTEIAYPRIRLIARGEAPANVRLSIYSAGNTSEAEVVLNGIDGYVEIDTETGEAYKGKESRNNIVGYSPALLNKLAPLKLLPGQNYIGLKFQAPADSPTLSRVEVIGRWWTI